MSVDGDREYWEKRAATYGTRASGYVDPVRRQYEDFLRWRALEQLVDVSAGGTALDAGCGTGEWAVRLAARGWDVTAIDLSPSLITLAPPHPRVTYRESSVQDFGGPGGKFDLILSVTVIQHITAAADAEAALANIARLLKATGVFVLIEFAPVRVPPRVARASYISARSAKEWHQLLANSGLRVRQQLPVRFFGERLHSLGAAVVRRVARPGEPDLPTSGLAGAVVRSGWRVESSLARVPGSSRFADVLAMGCERS